MFKLIASSILKIKSRDTKFLSSYPQLFFHALCVIYQLSENQRRFLSRLLIPCLLVHPVPATNVYCYNLYQKPMFIETNCTCYPCLLVHPVPATHVYRDKLYQLPMFIGTPCTCYPCLLGQTVPATHVYWDKLYLLPMFIGTNCTCYPCLSRQTVPATNVYWDKLYLQAAAIRKYLL